MMLVVVMMMIMMYKKLFFTTANDMSVQMTVPKKSSVLETLTNMFCFNIHQETSDNHTRTHDNL